MCGLSRLPAGKTGVSSPHHTPHTPAAYHSTVWKEWPKGNWQTPIISLAVHRGADNQTTAHRPGGTLPITGAMEACLYPTAESCVVLFPPTDYCSGCKIQDRMGDKWSPPSQDPSSAIFHPQQDEDTGATWGLQSFMNGWMDKWMDGRGNQPEEKSSRPP